MAASDERDFGYVFREDGIFHVFVQTDPETGDKTKTREEPVTGDDALALAEAAVPEEQMETFAAELKRAGGDAALALYRTRYPDHAERAAAYEEAVEAEEARRAELEQEAEE